MSPELSPPVVKRRWWLWLTVLVALLLLCAAGVIVTLRSAWFSNKVRERIVTEVEKASGGVVEIGSFNLDWKTVKASVGDFVLHGTEGATEAPLLRAKRIVVGLGVTSVFRAGVHVRTIEVDEPALHVIATTDGKTNLPNPGVKKSDQDFIDTLLTLAANEITIRNGSFTLNEHRIPLDLLAKDVNVRLLYNANRRKPAYYGEASSKQLRLQILNLGPMTFDFDSSVVLEHGELRVSKAKLSTRASKIEVSGFAYHLLNPSSNFGVSATLAVSEFAEPLRLPIEHKGVVQFAGKVSLELKERFSYAVEGRVKGRGLGIRQAPVTIENATLDSLVLVTPAGATLRRLGATALGGAFSGSAELAEFRKFKLDGVVKNVSTAKALLAAGQKPVPYVATANGPVHFEADISKAGLSHSILKTEMTLTAGIAETPTEIPLEGQVSFTWTQAAGTIELHQSHVSTSASAVDLSGTLGQRLDVTAKTTRLSDVQAMLAEPLPIQLKNGSAAFQGTIIGPLDDPRVEGSATLTNFVFDANDVDRLTADFSLTRDGIDVRSLSAAQGPITIDGSGNLRLQNWKATNQSPLKAQLNVRGARIEKLLADFKQQDVPITGAVTVSANLHGSASELAGDAQVSGNGVTAWEEEIERIKGNVKVSPDRVEISDGSALFHKSEIPFSGVFLHKPDEWKSGSLSFSTKTQAFDFTQIHNVSTRWPQWKGVVTSTLAAAGTIGSGAFRLTALNGDASVRDLVYEDRVVGSVDAHASTDGQEMSVTANAAVRGGKIRLNGEWKLDGNTYPGRGDVSTTSMSIQTLRDLFVPGQRTPLPFQSAVEAGATFKVPLTDPTKLTADLKVQRLFFAPGAAQRLGAGAKEQDLILENARPIVVHLTPLVAIIEPALFRATNTNIEVAGKVGFEAKQGWDLTLKGGLNLGQLQMFRQDLLASGTASIDTTVRGTLTDPQVNGSLTLSKASLYFGDLPAGLDNVNGVVSFDRNRATIQTMTADSGGGKMSVTGFVGFGGPALVYRMQGNANGVRVRYPEGASTTVNANLSLTGTSQESLLAGTVTIVRAAFTPRSDLGSLMANLTKAGAPSIPQDNDYIRGMQLDVRIESAPNLEFQTSLTRGLQAEVDLRLRGTAVRPTLLGDVGFSEGEISLFGNKYTLNRGDIRFFNPTRIEPVLDLEAETRARGIDVNVSFSGTPSKLNVSYRSDPPLQPSDIIALLAIGRDPNISAGIASSQITQQSTAAGLGNVVGEAVASSVTNRLQKFFGVTKIKIDPQLTGLDNIPQARLTLEQQVSKDITLTYITNIARTQETIVRIQWDLSREWSAIAVREENGLFGVDFQYKKRFK